MFSPPLACRTMFERIITSCTTVHGAEFPWFRGVSTSAYPFWPARQIFSMMLPSIVTRCAFFNSIVFFTVQRVPFARGVPDVSLDPVYVKVVLVLSVFR